MSIHNHDGGSPFLLLGDHAGNLVPRAMGGLGVDAEDLGRHIGWDIGIADLGRLLARSLDAVFIHQPYSRLLIDCNRAPGSASSIPPVSDGTRIVGNEALPESEALERVLSVHAPYHSAIAAEIGHRQSQGRQTILVSLHSFTPIMNGVERPWEIGVLHGGGDERFAISVLQALLSMSGICTGDNQPYRMDTTDYTIPRHAFDAGLPYVELELRQDLLGDGPGLQTWSRIVERALLEAAGTDGLSRPDAN